MCSHIFFNRHQLQLKAVLRITFIFREEKGLENNLSKLQKQLQEYYQKYRPEVLAGSIGRKYRPEVSAGSIGRKQRPEVSARSIGRKQRPEVAAGSIGRKYRLGVSAGSSGRKYWPEVSAEYWPGFLKSNHFEVIILKKRRVSNVFLRE